MGTAPTTFLISTSLMLWHRGLGPREAAPLCRSMPTDSKLCPRTCDTQTNQSKCPSPQAPSKPLRALTHCGPCPKSAEGWAQGNNRPPSSSEDQLNFPSYPALTLLSTTAYTASPIPSPKTPRKAQGHALPAGPSDSWPSLVLHYVALCGDPCLLFLRTCERELSPSLQSCLCLYKHTLGFTQRCSLK